MKTPVLLLLTALLTPSPLPASPWQVATTYSEVFDVAGPRADGQLVVEGGSGLALLEPATGRVRPFAPGYSGTHQFESYIAVVPAHGAASCFHPGDVYVIDQTPAGAVGRITEQGSYSAKFGVVPGVDGLGGIAFDTGGAFGGRLLVTGGHQGHTTLAAIDCSGAVTKVTTTAPTVEGGLAMAPPSFGTYGGDLIAPDELSGHVYAITPSGRAELIATPNLPHGGDIGIEGAGFVTDGDVGRDTALFADRRTPGSPHPGNDYLLAASGRLLKGGGVMPGDLLLGTEGGAGLVAVHCPSGRTSCSVRPVISPNSTSHGEGHLLVISGAASSTPAASSINRTPAAPASPLAPLILAVLALLVAAAIPVWHRRQRRLSH